MNSIKLYKKHSKRWLMGFILINVVMLSIFPIVNPYRLLPFSITIPGLNDVKPALYDRQRDVKIFDIAYIKPKTIILGSSRVLWGMDPSNPLLKKYEPVYNAGVLGPPIYEIDEYFKHALYNQPNLKRVILALDFYAFNDKFDGRDMNNGIFGKHWQEIIKARRDMIFDFHAIANTLFSSMLRRDIKSLRNDGRLIPDPRLDHELYSDFFNPPKVDPVQQNTNNAVVNVAKAEKSSAVKSAPAVPAQNMKDSLYQPFGISKQGMKALTDIIETCKKRHIELIIYLPPLQDNTEIVAFHQMKIWNQYRDYLHRVASMHDFWDFTGWNDISMNRDNFVDGSHHIFPVGNLILQKMLNRDTTGIPKNFGVLVSKRNIDSHLSAIDDEYRKRNHS